MNDGDRNEFWILGYGSLMWDPGFDFVRNRPALLSGFHRRFSVLSNGSYGRPDSPGLALGLHYGGSCKARAFQIAPEKMVDTLGYLDQRESAYLRKEVTIIVEDRGPVDALTYIVNPDHPRYAGHLGQEETVRLISSGSGSKGTSLGYLEKTVQELENQGMQKSNMHDLLADVRRFSQTGL